MKHLSLDEVTQRLEDLIEKQAELYPKFYMAELNYIHKKAELLMNPTVTGLGSQPVRDAECERQMSITTEYEEYHKLYPEMHVVDIQIRVYLQISRNLQA